MNQLLLLVQTEEHAKALPSASNWMKQHGITGCWVVFSPAVLCTSAEAGAAHDKRIEDITMAMKAAMGREDFDAAKSYKEQRDAAVLDRTAAVRDAWRKLDDAAQKQAVARVFGPFMESKPCANIRIDKHPDHFEPQDWIACLNSLKAGWFAPFTPGSFSVAWPTSLKEVQVPVSGGVRIVPLKETTKTAETVVPPTSEPVREKKKGGGNPMMSDPRYRELMKMPLDQLGEIGIKLGFTPAGTVRQVAAQVWKAERELMDKL